MPSADELKEAVLSIQSHSAALLPSDDGLTIQLVIRDVTGSVNIVLVWSVETVINLIESARDILPDAMRRQKAWRERDK